MPRIAHVAGAAAAVWISFAAWILTGPQPGAVRTVDNLLFGLLALANLVLAATAARSAAARLRSAWTLLAIGAAGWALGNVLLGYYDISRGLPPPSWADLAYLSFPLAACAALLLFPSARTGQSRSRLILDGALVAGSFLLISWLAVMHPILSSGEMTPAEIAVSLAYPIAAVLLLTVGSIVLFRARRDLRPTLTPLVAALFCVAIADSAFVYVSEIGAEYLVFVDIANFTWMLLLAVAITVGGHLEPDRDDAAAPALPGRVSLWLPYLPLLIAAGAVALAPRDVITEAPVLIVGAGLIVIALARQLVEAWSSRRLLIDVAEQGARDPLTGLANRTQFNDRLSRALRRAPVGVIALDLEHFKAVNDCLGHQAGDDLLRAVGARIRDCVRAGDTVARTGGDEFGVVVEGGAGATYRIADRIQRAFEQPFAVAEGQLPIRPSIGIAIADDLPRPSAEQLLARADLAMYAAKRSRSGGIHTYSPETELIGHAEPQAMTTDSPARVADISLLAELRLAITHSALDMLYQPMIDLRTGEVTGVEALLRWNYPRRGVLDPDSFLPLVRDHGLMGAVTDFAVNRALDDATRWLSGGTGPYVAVNVFAALLEDTALPGRIERALAARGLPGGSLTLEISEDGTFGRTSASRTALEELRRRGVRVSIDDFGTGHSDLSSLRELRVDEVKIDRDFIAAMTTDSRSHAIVRTLVGLAHELGLVAVAEGVEDAATAEALRSSGCDLAQGFHFSAPLSLDQLLDLIGSQQPGQATARNRRG